MKKGLLICALLALVLILFGCSAALEDAAEVASYEVGGESIDSIKTVVGSREVTGFEKQVGTDPKQTYTYKSDTVPEDLTAYTEYLISQEFLCTEGGEFATMPENAQFAKAAADEGKLFIVDLEWKDGGYTVTVHKMTGTLTAN